MIIFTFSSFFFHWKNFVPVVFLRLFSLVTSGFLDYTTFSFQGGWKNSSRAQKVTVCLTSQTFSPSQKKMREGEANSNPLLRELLRKRKKKICLEKEKRKANESCPLRNRCIINAICLARNREYLLGWWDDRFFLPGMTDKKMIQSGREELISLHRFSLGWIRVDHVMQYGLMYIHADMYDLK